MRREIEKVIPVIARRQENRIENSLNALSCRVFPVLTMHKTARYDFELNNKENQINACPVCKICRPQSTLVGKQDELFARDEFSPQLTNQSCANLYSEGKVPQSGDVL
ncbi:hypothetical protein ACKVWC_001021 [Pyricularia oryzae]